MKVIPKVVLVLLFDNTPFFNDEFQTLYLGVITVIILPPVEVINPA